MLTTKNIGWLSVHFGQTNQFSALKSVWIFSFSALLHAIVLGSGFYIGYIVSFPLKLYITRLEGFHNTSDSYNRLNAVSALIPDDTQMTRCGQHTRAFFIAYRNLNRGRNCPYKEIENFSHHLSR